MYPSWLLSISSFQSPRSTDEYGLASKKYWNSWADSSGLDEWVAFPHVTYDRVGATFTGKGQAGGCCRPRQWAGTAGAFTCSPLQHMAPIGCGVFERMETHLVVVVPPAHHGRHQQLSQLAGSKLVAVDRALYEICEVHGVVEPTVDDVACGQSSV